VNVLAVGVLTSTNVPLNEGSVTPETATTWFGANCVFVVVEAVTRPVASRVISEMLAGTVLNVPATETPEAGKLEVFETVRVKVNSTGVAVTEVGPLMPAVRVGRCVPDGIIAADGADSVLLPAMLVACTVNV
jgi:hypothetical protein